MSYLIVKFILLIEYPVTNLFDQGVADVNQKLQLTELDGMVLYARRFDACRELDPTVCCFKGNVKLSVSYDQTSIKYFKFTGEQVGDKCDGTLIVFPTKYSSTQKSVQSGGFSVTDIKGIFSYSFLTSYREYTENNQNKAEFELNTKTQGKQYYIDQYFMYNKVLSNIQPDPTQNPESPKNQTSSSNILIIAYNYMKLLTITLLFVFLF
ncbi:hypothetical protein TTHERM_00728850 (macronuclear) [Tetrahymena thermophila SB210]|uniref:Transmembrane protein n=1 Tax=Tetrahymena thermophila (strain SB210) TaxID=312017 RepID=I7M9P5_TETTS|nr:hypothetical protein TTHERM_00728850 [Tetrahymena thermophila SB210]EAS02426.2 hypothetical protein TTHERM_00728850 [Tetrahymena thermophila SB210]|eukprot:XP_001022671.2 hypothetical protein TTHERM_00728850 [Tetrahymena thermophila SB210]